MKQYLYPSELLRFPSCEDVLREAQAGNVVVLDLHHR